MYIFFMGAGTIVCIIAWLIIPVNDEKSINN